MTDLLKRAWTWVLDAFVDGDGQSTSMARLLAFFAFWLTVYAVHLGRDWQTVSALMLNGVVALLSRKRTGDE